MSTFELGRVLYTVDHDHWTKVSPTDPRTSVRYKFEVKRQLFEDRESMQEHTRTRKSSEDLVDTPGCMFLQLVESVSLHDDTRGTGSRHCS